MNLSEGGALQRRRERKLPFFTRCTKKFVPHTFNTFNERFTDEFYIQRPGKTLFNGKLANQTEKVRYGVRHFSSRGNVSMPTAA